MLALGCLVALPLPGLLWARGPRTVGDKASQAALEISQALPPLPQKELKPETPPALCPGDGGCLFPLSFPYTLLKSATYPIAYGGYLVQKNAALYKTFKFLTNVQKDYSFYPKIWFGDGGHFGGGFGFTHRDLLDRDYLFNVEYLLFTNLAMRSRLLFGNDNAFYAFNRAFSFWFETYFWREFHQDFYGVGNGSDQDNHSLFSKNRVKTGATAGFELISNLVFSTEFLFDTADSGTGQDGEPSVQDIFPPDQIPGFGEEIPYFVWGLKLVHDTRDNYINSQSGGRRLFKFEWYQDLKSHQFNYLQFQLLAEQYIRVGPPRYVLFLRNRWVFQNAAGGEAVPFYRLAVLDYNRGLRGFPGGRFRDTGSVVFNLEQRFPLWHIVDGLLFADAGRVFPGLNGFSFKNFKYSVGGGLRVYLGPFYIAAVEAGYGGEGVQVHLKFYHLLSRDFE